MTRDGEWTERENAAQWDAERRQADLDTMIDHYDGDSGAHLLTMPVACAEDCSRPGAMDEPVAYWRTRVTWVADEQTLRRSLESTGAWDDLDTADLDVIKDRVLWSAACDWRENEAEERRSRRT